MLRETLVFKGGTALKRCYFADYRFSEDLDFTLAAPQPLEDILAGLEGAYAEIRREAGIAFRFARSDRKSHTNSHTFYLAYDGPLPTLSPREVKVDITIREQLVWPVAERPVLRGYTEYEDLPDASQICVYSLEEIAAEKVIALMDKARNEPRDLYDLWYLATERQVDFAALSPAIERKLAFRARSWSAMSDVLAAKEARYKVLWSLRLEPQMSILPPFEEVFRTVRRQLREAGLQ